MNAEAPCPGQDKLERLLVGAIPVEELEALQGHVAGCPRCLEAMREITKEDAFVLALRASGRTEGIASKDADPTLLSRLRRLYSSVKATATHSLDTFVPESGRVEDLYRLLTPPEEPDELGRFGSYAILRCLGSGGMGVVFAARQVQPRRTVALKMILAAARGEQQLARFRSETEIIAQLQHPNIVPIYEVGEHEDRPYYSMEYLDGGSLAQRLAVALLVPRTAAELALVLARAIHFAHERGIVHRDLKPANVLLAADGAPKIVDFGLAKQLGGDREGAPFHTESGAILGTPAYMAPEQVESKNKIGPAADVYALGAILYECLTGRPPFRAATVLETLEQVRQQEPPPISRLQPKVPRDLQTICMTCLHKEPGRRYGSAALLADDLARFLGGKPIQARPVSARERLWKWTRRNPVLTVLLTVTCLSLIALVASSVVYNARLRAAVEQAQDKEAQTRRQYRQAHDTLEQMVNRLESPRLAEVPQLKELQRSLLEDALAFYQGILQQADSSDPAMRKDTALACKRAADIESALGQSDAAAENYRRAIELLEGLPAEDRASPEIQGLQAVDYLNWGAMASQAGRIEEAVRLNGKALELLERVLRQRPDDPELQNELAKAEHNRGGLFGDKNPAEAEPHYRKALALRMTLVRDHPEQERYQARLAEDYQDLGLLYQHSNRAAEASPLFAKAEAILRPLVERHPAEQSYALSLAALYINWCYLLAAEDRIQEALERLDLAVRLAEDALRREPKDVTARSRTLTAHGARAEIREGAGRFADSVADWDRVLELEDGPNRNRWRGARARLLTLAGDHTRAAAEIDELTALPKNKDKDFYFLAAVYSLAIGAAHDDRELSVAERERLAESYAARAMALLRKLQDKGYFRDANHAKALKCDEELQPLREREDFRRLLAAVGNK